MFGFAVLLGLGMYVYLAKVAVRFVGKRTESKLAKYATIAVFVLIPTWDIIPGHLYFSYLCGKEAGTRVLKTVEVEKEYFLPDGRPDEKKLGDRFRQPSKTERSFSTVFHIMKHESTIEDKQTGEILGHATSLTYFGGWLNAYLFAEGSSTTCPEYHGSHGIIWREVIRPKDNLREGGK